MHVPKRIAHLVSTNFYGGPEKQILEQVRRLNPKRYLAVIASFIENGKPNELLYQAQKQGLPNVGIPMWGPLDFRALFTLYKFLRDYAIDLLLTHEYKSTIMGWLTARMSGLPVLSFSRGYTNENLKVRFYYFLDRQILKRVDGIIAVSKAQESLLRSFGIKNRCWVVRNAIALTDVTRRDAASRDRVCREFGIPTAGRIVVAAGRLSTEKGHTFLVEAASEVQASLPDVYFVFCGDGIRRTALMKRARELGLSERCKFVGFRHDLQDIFAAMEMLVLPSLSEGLPNVVLEAFSHAKPVVASEVGGVPEIIVHGRNGILVPPAEPRRLAQAIQDILRSPREAQELGEAGFLTARNKFSFESQIRDLESVYGAITGSY